MTVTSGYGLTNLSDTVTLNLDKSQGRLQSDVSKLSSGLRINSAADDPSGLAITEGLRAKVNGYDQATSNVQDATNALTVAGRRRIPTTIRRLTQTLCYFTWQGKVNPWQFIQRDVLKLN